MENAKYSYPHPVLGLGDDVQGEFSISMNVSRASSERQVKLSDITTNISNDYFEQLLKGHKIQVAVVLYCSATMTSWTFVNPGESILLDENEVATKLELNAYLLASEDIDEYFDETFNEKFEETLFSVHKGQIVGQTGKLNIPIEKEDEKLGVGNIFKFSPLEEEEPMSIDLTQDKIYINYPVDDKGNHPPRYLFEKHPWTGYNLYILPALAQALKEMDENADEVKDKEWFLVIDNILPEDLRVNDPFVDAQLLLKESEGLPIHRAVKEIHH